MATTQAAAVKSESAPTPPPAVTASAPSPETAERLERLAADKVLRAKGKPIFDALCDARVGLGRYSSSILAAHVCATLEDVEAMKAEEIVQWAIEWKRLHPVLWQSIKNQNLMGFAAQLKRHGFESKYAQDYANMATVIRG